jgi:hypothetical protein
MCFCSAGRRRRLLSLDLSCPSIVVGVGTDEKYGNGE